MIIKELDLTNFNPECMIVKYKNDNPDVMIGIHDKVPGHYILSNGKVYSKMTESFMKGCIAASNNNYHKMMVRYDGVKRNMRVHRLVAETFLENKDNLPQVDHIDRNRINNDISNLRWVTAKENNLNRDMSYLNRQ